jgi:hypothetical protein
MNPLAYSEDYVQYDEHGIKSIHCMLCGTVVKRRTEKLVDHPSVPGQKVIKFTLAKLPNWRQRKVTIERNGRPAGFIEPIVCADCVGIPIDFERLAKQVKGAMQKELAQHGRELKDVDIRAIGEIKGRAG